jgi:hypothetical protein
MRRRHQPAKSLSGHRCQATTPSQDPEHQSPLAAAGKSPAAFERVSGSAELFTDESQRSDDVEITAGSNQVVSSTSLNHSLSPAGPPASLRLTPPSETKRRHQEARSFSASCTSLRMLR